MEKEKPLALPVIPAGVHRRPGALRKPLPNNPGIRPAPATRAAASRHRLSQSRLLSRPSNAPRPRGGHGLRNGRRKGRLHSLRCTLGIQAGRRRHDQRRDNGRERQVEQRGRSGRGTIAPTYGDQSVEAIDRTWRRCTESGSYRCGSGHTWGRRLYIDTILQAAKYTLTERAGFIFALGTATKFETWNISMSNFLLTHPFPLSTSFTKNAALTRIALHLTPCTFHAHENPSP